MMTRSTARTVLLALLAAISSSALTFALAGPASADEPETTPIPIIESDLLDLDDHGMWIGPGGVPVFIPGSLSDPDPGPRWLPPVVGGI